MEDHSIQGYLSRRTTEELDLLLHDYLENEDRFARDEIVRIILRILAQREKDIPVEMTPELEKLWQQYLEDSI